MRGTRRRAVREIHDVIRAATPTHAHLRERVGFVLVTTVLLDAVASVLVLLFERDASRTEITNLGDAAFWTTTQLLTVSSQLPNPISAPGAKRTILGSVRITSGTPGLKGNVAFATAVDADLVHDRADTRLVRRRTAPRVTG